MSDGGFVLVHYDQIGIDERFADIRDDDRRMGLWLRLLCLADAVWPADAPLPSGVSRPTLTALVDAGVVEMVDRHKYRLHGLDNERKRRSEHGRMAAQKRWSGNPPVMPEQCPSNAPASDEHGIAGARAAPPSLLLSPTSEERIVNTPLPPTVREPALDAYSRLYPVPTRDGLKFLDELIAEYGQEPVARAIGVAGSQGRDKLLSRTRGVLALQERNTEKQDEQKRLASKRAPVAPVRRELSPEEQARADEAFAKLRTDMAGIGVIRPKKEEPPHA
jgi:hypothetical protein